MILYIDLHEKAHTTMPSQQPNQITVHVYLLVERKKQKTLGAHQSKQKR